MNKQLAPGGIDSDGGVLAKLGLDRDQVARSFACSVKKMSCGRGGLPKYVVDAMYADYGQLKSLSKVGQLYGRTRQSVYEIFSSRGLPLNKRAFKPVREYNGRKYTPGKDGYWRDTIFRDAPSGIEPHLHRAIWADVHGPIPDGHQVSFKDGDKNNCSLENLFCLPVAEVTLYHWRRHYPDRAQLTPEQRREWWKAFYRRYAAGKRAEFVKKGLDSKGRNRRRNANGELKLHGRAEWKFNYFPPVIVRQDANTKTLRRSVGSFSANKTRFDLDYEQFKAEMESEKTGGSW